MALNRPSVPYIKTTDFSEFQNQNPNNPLPAPNVDQELERVALTIDEIRQRLAMIQRDDGEVANRTIGLDQLKSELFSGVNPPEPWESQKLYNVGDAIVTESAWYFCVVNHLSSPDLEDDIAAGYWRLLIDLSIPTQNAIAAKEAAQLAQTAAETAQSLAETAQTGAETAQTNAETAQTNAETAETNTLASQQLATSEADRALAEANRSETEADRALAEANRSQTQADRSETEADRSETEADRAQSLINQINADLVVSQTNPSGAAQLPTGTIAERPSNPTEGMFRRNSETGAFEGYDGTSWTGVGGASGGAGNPFVYQHDNVVTQDYTIPSGQNAMSAGPLTIEDGVTITVEHNATWVLV